MDDYVFKPVDSALLDAALPRWMTKDDFGDSAAAVWSASALSAERAKVSREVSSAASPEVKEELSVLFREIDDL